MPFDTIPSGRSRVRTINCLVHEPRRGTLRLDEREHTSRPCVFETMPELRDVEKLGAPAE